ncbi:DNA-directed RNA polymerase I subunit RPA43 [Pogonomyrmex barbatus]|uniref:DNA-directed RNA polymerase I subunit RPA43 n=1 Tax=Pogonomyrmex barbatus TaxID=144034 RepID=A0A6I9WTC2_9HYME|nr:DNA-directed RNA polymerase I subunit RPA43 [Pogonomyrmex barbatus]
MKQQTDCEVTWTSLELTGLLEDEEAHVHFTRTIKHLALHPYHLNNVQRGLNQILVSSLNTYDRELKGFVLAFRNSKLLNNLGATLYDSPFIHVDIEADFYLFRPTVGSFLKGVVNKKGLDHIVVLVHKIYTISIPKPDDVEEWPGDSVEIGQEVKCCVNQIDNKSKPPFICAILNSDYSQGCKLLESINNIDNMDSAIETYSANSIVKIENSINGMSEDKDDNVSEKERRKHRKKHKKSRESLEIDLKIENESEIETDNVSKKHKKSKKISKSFNNDTDLDEHIEIRKAVKRENSIPLDSVTERETKKRKKHAKKSRESDSEFVIVKNEEGVMNNTESTISIRIKSEKDEQHENYNMPNTSLSSSNSEILSISKKHKKNKKSPMVMSDSESDHIVKIKIEKQDPENQSFYSENQAAQKVDEIFKTPKFIKSEDSDKERKKSSKKQALRDSLKIKSEDDVINDANDALDKERKKSPKKHAKASRDSDSKAEFKIKKEVEIINDTDISDKEGKKSSKKYAKAFKDSDSKAGLRIKSEIDILYDDTSDREKKKI